VAGEAGRRSAAGHAANAGLLDSARGSFAATPHDSANSRKGEFCFDTKLPGNNNVGHLYGTDLDQAEKADLLAYLLTKVLA